MLNFEGLEYNEESFTLMTPEGHMFAGWITFSAFEQDGTTIAQAQVLMRANDPFYEVGLMLGGHRKENEFWKHTLRSLASHLGVEGEVSTQAICVDPKRQWSRSGNIRHNAAIRSGLFALGSPLRAVTKSSHKTGRQP